MRTGEYVHITNEHIQQVKNNYKLLTGEELDEHDSSRFTMKERPDGGHSAKERLLFHQNENPHHWQYWVLITDKGRCIPLDMPEECVKRMVCDWSAICNNDPDKLTIYWEEGKRKFILSSLTDRLANKYVYDLIKKLRSGVRWN